MNTCVSRRNRRKTKSQIAPHRRDYVLLFVSLAVFFGALTCFAWAVPPRSSPQGQTSTSSVSSSASNTQDSVYTGKIASGQNQSSASSSSTASTSSNVSSSSSASSAAGTPPEPAIAPEEALLDSPASTNSQHHEVTGPRTETEQVEVYEQEQSYHIVHHTAYQEYPVYTTVHHQASTPHEVYSNGSVHIEWTSCPACGAQHSISYNERAVDHVNEVCCSACGGKHASDYDEIIYD